ncbi:MAG: DUF5320 domain-containing protein [Dehalococcoidales bacterium]|nr:DUF5320 domain-containing protein [Dehalococcoidales bacterium]
MPGFDGTGPRGMGPMTGGGRGFCSPWGIGATGRYGSLGRTPYTYPRYGVFASTITREQELEFLKSQAEALKNELKNLENQINQFSGEKK